MPAWRVIVCHSLAKSRAKNSSSEPGSQLEAGAQRRPFGSAWARLWLVFGKAEMRREEKRAKSRRQKPAWAILFAHLGGSVILSPAQIIFRVGRKIKQRDSNGRHWKASEQKTPIASGSLC